MSRKPSIITPASTSKHIFMGIHGDTGIGKTRLIGTATELGKTLIVRPPTDHLDSLLPANKAAVEQAVVRDWADMDQLLEFARSDSKDLPDWWFYDTLSALFHTLLDDVWDSAVRRTPSRADFDLDKGEFGINMNRLSRHLRHIVGADAFNVGFTAWSETAISPDKDSEGEAIEKLMPWVQGKGMPAMAAGYMNVVAYYTKAKIGGKEGTRVLRTESSPNWYAKDQFDAFGGRVVNPTMPKIVGLIEKSPGRQAVAAKKTTKRPASRPARRRVTTKR